MTPTTERTTHGAPAPEIDPTAFRATMGALPTGVTIVTALDPDATPRGFTANAVSSLSVDPPLVLVCVNKDASTHPVLTDAAPFAVNILGRDHEDLARRFAQPGPRTFPEAEFTHEGTVPPTVTDALGVLQCRHHATVDGGDHSIVVGRVIDARLHGGDPLVFHQKAFHHIPAS